MNITQEQFNNSIEMIQKSSSILSVTKTNEKESFKVKKIKFKEE